MTDLFSQLNDALNKLSSMQVSLPTILLLGGALYGAKRVLFALPKLSLGWVSSVLSLVPVTKAPIAGGYALASLLIVAGFIAAGSTIGFETVNTSMVPNLPRGGLLFGGAATAVLGVTLLCRVREGDKHSL
jgi:hypothetical protein